MTKNGNLHETSQSRRGSHAGCRRAAVRVLEIYDELYAWSYDTLWLDGKYAADLEQLAPFLERVPSSERILDVGCGTGTHCRTIRSSHPRIEGLDLSESMLAIARRKSPDSTFTRGSMLDGSLYPAGSFALVLSTFCPMNYLETEDEYLIALKNFYRWLRPGGWVYLELKVLYDGLALGSGSRDCSSLRHTLRWTFSEGGRFRFHERVEATESLANVHHLFLLEARVLRGLALEAGFESIEVLERQNQGGEALLIGRKPCATVGEPSCQGTEGP